MARVYTKIGDVFSAKIDDNNRKFFQLVAYDLTQLNSDVIRAFKRIYPINEKPDLSDIVNGEVEFYVHCVTKWGVKMNLWEKYAYSSNIGDNSQVLFRGTNDYGSKPGEQILVSNNWYIWKINDENFTRVGKLEGNNRNAYIGIVMDPIGTLDLLKENKFPGFYPGFE